MAGPKAEKQHGIGGVASDTVCDDKRRMKKAGAGQAPEIMSANIVANG